MKKRIIALLLVCLMVVSAVPAWAGAEEVADTSGTSEAATCPGEGAAHTLENCPGATPIGHKDPTCADNEETQYQCPVCEGTFWVEVKDTATGLHTWNVLEDYVPAVCEEEGHTAHRVCTVCGEEELSETIPALQHDWEFSRSSGDCTSGGTITYKCSLCGEEKTEQYEEGTANHVWKPEAEILKAPTCQEMGKARYTCALCGTTMDVNILPALCADLQTLEWVPQENPTCTKPGVQAHWRCTVCGKTYYSWNERTSCTASDLAIPALGHSYETGDGGYAPTCTSAGYCTRCGYVEKVPHDTTGVEWEVDVEPTCLAKGHRQKTCKTCRRVVTEEDISALGHTTWTDDSSWERKYGDTPCNGSDGVRFWRCGRCNARCTEPVTGGHITAKYSIPVHCNADGIDITYCKFGSGCTVPKYIVDTEAGTVTIGGREWNISELLKTDKDSFVKMDDENVYIAIVDYKITAKPANAADKDHKWKMQGSDPAQYDLHACEKEETAECEWCGKTKKVAPATGHVWVEVSPYKAPDCEKPGQKAKWECKYCHTIHVEFEGSKIAALGHEYTVHVDGKAATCNENGYTDYVVCERCGSIDPNHPKETRPCRHNESRVNAKNPNGVTCGEVGYELWGCSRGKACDKTNYVNGYVVKGYKIGGEHEFVRRGYTLGVDYQPETCTEDGWMIEICTKCSATRKVTLAKRGHHNLLGEELFDDCRDTTTHRYCVTCHETIGQSHAPEAIKSDKKAATCTEAGYEKEWCTNCGRTLKDETIAATGHTKGNWVTKSQPSHLEDGLDQEICPKCNTVLSSKTTTRPGFDYELTADNAVVSEAGYVDSSLVAVTVALKSKGVGVSSILFDLTYDKDVMKFVKYEFDETTPFISGRRVNDLKDKGSVRVLASIPNDEAGKVADTNLQNVKGDVIITLYFRIISDSASSATFGIDMTTSSAINKSEKPVEFFGDTEAIVIGNILDLNKDGSVDLADAQIMLKMINRELMDGAGQAITYNVSADVDKDGSVNADDLSVMYDYLAGIVDYEDVVKLGTEGDPVDPAPEEAAA